MAISAFSNFTLTAYEGGTVPSLDYSTNKVFVDIGSGNVLKLVWDTPTATNNRVSYYVVHILQYNALSGSFSSLSNINVGAVNEFYLKSSLLTTIEQAYYPLRIYIEAVSKYGAAYNGVSHTVTAYVSKGCGTYIKVEDGYTQPIMKRALALTNLDYVALIGDDGKALAGTDGKTVYTKAAVTQDGDTGWALMQYFYSKGSDNTWAISDIQYEVLMDADGNIVTDPNNEPVYVL